MELHPAEPKAESGAALRRTVKPVSKARFNPECGVVVEELEEFGNWDA